MGIQGVLHWLQGKFFFRPQGNTASTMEFPPADIVPCVQYDDTAYQCISPQHEGGLGSQVKAMAHCFHSGWIHFLWRITEPTETATYGQCAT
eukprot:853389-Amphidinium_carterae.1